MELGPRGSRLWASLTAQDAELASVDCPRHETALTACRAADRLDALEALAAETPFVLEGKSGPLTHPVHVEVRQAGLALARHLAALRLPDEATGKRPQRRQVRGVQAGSVSSLDRARAAKGA